MPSLSPFLFPFQQSPFLFLFQHTYSNESNSLTIFFVKQHLQLQLVLVLEGLLDLHEVLVAGLQSVQKFTCATFLHDLRSGITGQLAETVRTIHDRIQRGHLSVA